MARKASIIAVVLVLCAAYWAWPYFDLYALARDAQAHNSAAVAERVDFRALRRSVARQIIASYLRQSGRGQKMGAFERGMATAIGTTVADPYLAQLLSPEALTALLGEGQIRPLKVGDTMIDLDQPLPKLPDMVGGQALHVVLESFFDGPLTFVFRVRADRDGTPYGVHVRLDGRTWRLSGIDLTAPIVDRIASDIVAKEKAGRQS